MFPFCVPLLIPKCEKYYFGVISGVLLEYFFKADKNIIISIRVPNFGDTGETPASVVRGFSVGIEVAVRILREGGQGVRET